MAPVTALPQPATGRVAAVWRQGDVPRPPGMAA
jgi:hypothetical protein